LGVSIAFKVEPPNHTSLWEGTQWVPRRTSTRLLGPCMDMQEGVLLGVCRGCVCSREWIPRQKSGGCGHTCANSGNGYKVRNYERVSDQGWTSTRKLPKVGIIVQVLVFRPATVASSAVAGELLASRP